MIRAGVNKIHKASTAVKLCEENSSVGLRLGSFDPLKTWPYTTTFAAALSKNSTTIATHPHFLVILANLDICLTREVFYIYSL